MQQAIIEQQLSMKRIPYNVADNTSFFNRKEVQTMLGYLKIALYGTEINLHHVKDLANKPYRKFSADLINSWEDYGDFLQFCSRDQRGGQYQDQLDYLEQIGKADDIGLLFDAIVNRPVFWGPWANKNAGISADMKPTQIISGLAKLAGARTINELIQAIESIQKFCKETSKDKDRVTISTIHRAKGLEWEEVYIPGCVGELFPHKNNFDTEEERRLFYVAITRAKSHLTLTTHKTEPPSPFVESVLEHIESDEIFREGLAV